LRRPLALAAPVIAAVALLAGCGSSSSSTTSSAASTPASTPTQSTATSTTAAAGSGVVLQTKHGKLGTILAAGPKHLTVYMFEADKGSTSSCNGECAKAWPPVTTAGKPAASGGAVAADLGTTMRSDGTEQVTYKGHPLYFFVKDEDSGDSYGQGANAFGADWYVLKPNGSKVDEDSGDESSPSSS
jgi:predicted lipoprotein with Yx(FWY)xxD motif